MSLPQTQQVMEPRRGSVTFPPQNWAERAEILMDLMVHTFQEQGINEGAHWLDPARLPLPSF